MSLKSYLKGIADAIREKKGTTEPINAQNFASEIKTISGGENALKKLLDNTNSASHLFYARNNLADVTDYIKFNDTSNVTNMSGMFYNCHALATIPLLDTSNVDDMDSMFVNCHSLTTIPLLDTSNVIWMDNMFNGCSRLTNIPLLNTSNVISMVYMFKNCSDLTTIPLLDTSNVTDMKGMFDRCTNLTDIPVLDIINVTDMKGMFNMFRDCSNLTNLTLKNIRVKLQVGSGSSWGHLLTLESLIGLCQECVQSTSSLTLTVGTANLEKLASVYVKLTNEPEEVEGLIKLPMIQCESTDEGAMLIADYMALKNWVLA